MVARVLLPSASKQAKLINFLKPQTIATSQSHHVLLLRHLSAQSLPPPSPQEDQSVITEAVQLLKFPENDWNLTELNRLLFSSSSSTYPHRFFGITRRLESSSKALNFFDYVRKNLPPEMDSTSLSPSFQVIYELASREPNSGNVLLELYKASKERNIPLTINNATFLIQALGKAGMVDQVHAVFNDLNPSFKNVYVRNVFIHVLLRNGSLDSALQVLDEMLQPKAEFPPNDITCDIVFSNLLKRHRLGRSFDDEEIVNLALRFGGRGVFLDTVKLTQLISKLCWNGKTGLAWDVLHDVMKLGGPIQAASCNALLTTLGRERSFDRMNMLMVKMKELEIQPNVVTFGILINHLCKFRRVDEALEVLEKMKGDGETNSVSPDVITYNTLIDGLCKVGRQEEGLGLMKKMVLENGLVPNTVTYNCLIDGFCKAGQIEMAHELFDQMNNEGVRPNVITINTLVDGMCKHGRTKSAVEFFNEIQNEGLIKGNEATYTAFINAFCNVNNIDQAIQFFDEMVKNGCSPDAIVYYTLISGLTRAGRLDDASLVVSKLKEAGFGLDLVCYNLLLNGFCKKNKLHHAYQMLKEMEQSGVKPDNITYNTLISYFSKVGNFKDALRVMKKMTDEGLVPTIVTYGALIHAFCLHGNTYEAMRIFKEMGVSSKIPPNTIIYNTLIDSLCKSGEGREFLALWDDMNAKGVKPDTSTYNAVFKGLRDRNLLENAFEVMDKMVEHACNPDYITMEILTEWLSSIGETTKLRKFVQGYKVSGSSSNEQIKEVEISGNLTQNCAME